MGNYTSANELPKEFCLKYTGRNTIYYIGAIHTNNPSSKTFITISKIIPLVKALVIEGYSGDVSKAGGDRGEAAHAIRTALKLKIPVIGAETPTNQLVKIISSKYSIDDLRGWVFLVIARQSYDQEYSYDEMMRDYKKYSKWYVNLLSVKTKFSPLEWFSNTFGTKYVYGKFLDHSSPRSGPQITRAIARDIAELRNPLLIKRLLETAKKYGAVAYVIGRDHIKYDMEYLVKSFGRPTMCSLGAEPITAW